MEILWTQEAIVHLTEIEEFIAQDSPERAERFVDALLDQVESMLSENHRIGRAVPEASNPDIRELLHKNYRIIYRLTHTHIEILTVFEGHRLPRPGDMGM